MTFQELMDCRNDGDIKSNQFVYGKILELAKDKNLIPVIGAGLSVWVDYPGWGALLRSYAAQLRVETTVEAHLKHWRYDEAAEVLKAACRTEEWEAILKSNFDPGKISEKLCERPGYQLLLPKIFPGLVLTTNFDKCLERLYHDPIGVNPSDIFQADLVERARRDGRHLLIKLHGDIEHHEKMVLTKSAYDEYYGGDPLAPDLTKPLPAFLAAQVKNRPLLFLGCSLHQDRTCAVLRACVGNGDNYALLEMPNEKEFEQRDRELQEMGINPIWYPAGQHNEALTAFFTQLAADCRLRERTAVGAPVYPLVGRDEVVEELCTHFTGLNPEPRWVTGVAGIGKTEVCREVLRRLAVRHPDFSMPMVDCTDAKTLEQFYAAIVRTLNVEVPAHEAAAPGEFLARYIAQKCDGVYFDNFEDPWRGTAGEDRQKLMSWLQGLREGGLALLFSTQDDLPRVLGQGVKLTELDSGAADAMTMAEEDFWELDSVKLFTSIYGYVDRAELLYLRKLIRQMEGHPLAVVLTAVQAREKKVRGLRAVVDRWDAAQVVYRGNRRHTSLAKALALVWEAVKDDSAAGFYWALQSTAVQPIPQDARKVPDRITRLNFHDLLLQDGEQSGMDHLQTGSLIRREEAGVSMLLPIKKQLSSLLPQWQEIKVKAVHRWAAALTALMDLADEGGNPARTEAHSLAIELMPQVCHVLEMLAAPEYDGIDPMCRLLAAAGNHYQYDLSSLKTLQMLAGSGALDDHPRSCAIAYEYTGDLLCRLGDLDKALSAYDEAEKLYRKQQDDLGLANTIQSRGDLLRWLGEVEKALSAYDEAEKLFRKEQNDLGLANTIKYRGNLLLRLGDLDKAQLAYDEAEKLYRKEQDDLGLANTIKFRGDLLSRLGEVEKALSAYDEAEKLYRKEQADLGLANTLQSRGDLFLTGDWYREALEQYRSACGLYRKLREPIGWGYTLADQYRCLVHEGLHQEAVAVCRELEELLPRLTPDVQSYCKSALSLGEKGSGGFWKRLSGALKAMFRGRKT